MMVHGSWLPKEILPQVDEGIAVADLTLPEAPPSRRPPAGRADRGRCGGAGQRRSTPRIGPATDEEVLAGADPGSPATAQLIIPVPDGREPRSSRTAPRVWSPTWRLVPWRSTLPGSRSSAA